MTAEILMAVPNKRLQWTRLKVAVPTRNSVHSVIIEVSKFRLLTSHTGNLVEEPPTLCVPFPGVIYNIKDKRSSRDN
jgi:hypothetical protein